MKKMILAVAIGCTAAFANAAAVGWNLATGSGATYAGDAYKFFVIGQNNVASVSTITALLDAGTDVSSYQFGSGTISSTGAGSVAATASGKELGAGTFNSFFVLFDSADPVAGKAKYVVISGAAGLTKSLTASTSSTTFASGNASSILGNSSNWAAYGSAGPIAPEPTSGLLILLGMAGLALKRKVA